MPTRDQFLFEALHTRQTFVVAHGQCYILDGEVMGAVADQTRPDFRNPDRAPL